MSTWSGRRLRRLVGGALGAAVLVLASACGFDVQTLQPYTPAEGVSVNVANGPNGPVTGTIEVRGLMVISRESGSGFLSASMVTQGSDSLTGVSGHVIKTDGSQGSDLAVSLPAEVSLLSNQLVVLTDQAAIEVTGADLAAGQTVDVTLTFAKAGSQQVVAPIIDGNFPPYSTVSPSPAPSASASS